MRNLEEHDVTDHSVLLPVSKVGEDKPSVIESAVSLTKEQKIIASSMIAALILFYCIIGLFGYFLPKIKNSYAALFFAGNCFFIFG